ncbi:MADS-box transcription factor, other eukaryote [[Emmonsia] crescens]|uniref:MADS-box transcription factor, other eukaryote n=1 Tax=[Emmonsia] crescens TaxID=73230 RepID=A0A2B7Z645_9EURO|nr:MADS-box transcription factor, other eukaryote [Emmonsia crescens]
MGRRKIEIKAIKDDRNRSVTFLKRKGGLFKKAHELSVLCSVDVAVIIFGHNKKLYEFSSGDIKETLGRYHYYGQPHEHKGPADFAGKQNLDDDDEDDVSGVEDIIPPQTHNMVPPQMQNQSTFQHINHQPSASPPMPNGVFHPRHGTPQPVISRPSSRNNLQRVGSGLVPQQQRHHATPPPPQNGYAAYMPNPSMYNPQANPNMPQQAARPGQYPYPPPMPQQQQQQQPPQHASQQPPPQQPPQHHPHHPQQQQHPPTPPPPPAQHQHQSQPQPPRNHTPQPHHQPMGQPPPPYLHEQQKRHSVASTFPPPERQVQSHSRSPPQPQPPSKPEHSLTPPPPKPLPSKSRSIFTPIDDRGSVLAQHFGFGPQSDSPRTDSPLKPEPENTDSTNHCGPSLPPPLIRSATLPAHPQRTHSLSSIPDVTPISRSNSLQVGAKRPRLKVQIPSENSDDAGSATAESSPRESTGNTAATPARGSSDTGHSGVVLPPPSPSASALLSAGAQGPPNPFARPPPPSAVVTSSSQNNAGAAYSNSNNNNIDTPISALPSRFVSDTLLPSPSSFYPEWGFGRSGPDSNVLPSPLTFPTPVMANGPGFSNSSLNLHSHSGAGLGSGSGSGSGLGSVLKEVVVEEVVEVDKKRKSPEGGMSAGGAGGGHGHGHASVAAGKRVKVE